MKTVHKFVFDVEQSQTDLRMEIPVGSKVVAFQIQRGLPTMWVELVPESPMKEQRWFSLFGTGHQVPESAEHRGTVVMADGRLVLHLYER